MGARIAYDLRTERRSFMMLRTTAWIGVASLLAPAAFAQSRVTTLSQLLNNPKLEVRKAAATELGDLGPTAAPAAPALVEALKDKEIMVRAEAASALVRIG